MTIASVGPAAAQQAPERRAITAQGQTPPRAEGAPSSAQGEILSPEEKQFFARMYPGDSTEIINYSTYTRSGLAAAGAVVGSLIDTKS